MADQTMTMPSFRNCIHMPDGEKFVPALMKVESRDEEGRPENLVLVPFDRVLEVEDGQEFLVVYVNERVLGV